MKSIRTLPILLVLVFVGSVLTGCKRGPSEEELKLAELQMQYTTIEEQYATLTQTRADLESATATLAEIEGTKERDRTDEQKAQLEELPAQIEELTAARDMVYEEVQAKLAEFLNVGLNEFPQMPETTKVLDIYSQEAVVVSKDMVVKAGDYKKAIDHLNATALLYEQVGLEVNPMLAEVISDLDERRFITQERFDSLKNGMTKDEVKEIAGVPYYQNIQLDEKRGVETWLYRKRDGGAAAVYFKIKTDKSYGKKFDAITTKVVE
jgi:hypothetical protein